MNLGLENETTEHKRSTSELREAMESVTAILNKHGYGTLYFGVRPIDGEVIGQDVSEKTMRDISQAFGNRIDPCVIPTIERLVTEDGKPYVKVTFSGDERPYACDGRYRIRSADEDILMNRATLAAMMRDNHYAANPWDREPSNRSIEEIDEGELSKFIERGRARGRITFEYTDAETVLSSLGLIIDGKPSNAADVLFFPSKDIQLKMGMFVDHRRTDVLDMRQESGTLFSLVDAAETYVTANTRRRFVFSGDRTRDEIPEIPREVVREALLNAFCHREWQRSGYVQIDIYSDTIEIISPGWFIEGQDPEEHLKGISTSSDTRNKLIAQTLFRSGDIESSGLGIQKIRDLCGEAGVGIRYEHVPFGTKLTLTRPAPYDGSTLQLPGNHSGSAANTALGTVLVPSSSKSFQVSESVAQLSNSERIVLSLLIERGSSTTAELSEAVDMSRRGTLKLLQRLIDRGLVLAEGSRRTRRYRASHPNEISELL